MECPLFLIFLVFLFKVSCSRHVVSENNTQIETTDGTLKSDVSTLEEALAALNQLTAAQKRVWEQQETHREDMQSKFSQFSEKEDERSKALEAEQNLLKEIRGKISRKLKVLAKNGNGKIGGGQQSNCNGFSVSDVPPKDCAAIYLDGDESSGVYRVWPTWNQNQKDFLVYCDMDTDGGGWTVIHRWENVDISEDYFERPWEEYKNGFGDLTTSFWLGTNKMNDLTKQGSYELRFDFQGDGDKRTSSVYRRFRVDDQLRSYAVHVEGFVASGTGEDIFSTSSAASFSTKDNNNLKPVRRTTTTTTTPHYYHSYGRGTGSPVEYDSRPNCAITKKRGWWFTSDCHLDQILHFAETSQTKIEMKIRPAQFLENSKQ